MMLADNSSIIGFIISFPYFLDIILVLFLFIGASIGYARGFWRGTFNLIITIILLLISWFVLLDAIAVFVNTRLFSLLGVTFKVGEFSTSSIEELIGCIVELFKNELPEKYSNPDYISSLSSSICKSIAWLVVVISIHLLSWVLSGILYFLIMRLVIPEKLRKVKLRLIGALMGLIQAVVIVFAYIISLSNISPAFSSISNSEEGGGWFDSNIQMVLEAFNPYNSMVSPYVKTIENGLGSKFGFVIDEKNYKLGEEFKEFFELISKITANPSEDEENNEAEELSMFIIDYVEIL
ncbi:MAG: hypothetical protein J1F31_01250 [Erysipelotrichales bacterium]|nr:hypothetical protein [Erysipelotrichales bacterium]